MSTFFLLKETTVELIFGDGLKQVLEMSKSFSALKKTPTVKEVLP